MIKQLTIFMDSLVHYRLPKKYLIIFTIYFLLHTYSLKAYHSNLEFPKIKGFLIFYLKDINESSLLNKFFNNSFHLIFFIVFYLKNKNI